MDLLRSGGKPRLIDDDDDEEEELMKMMVGPAGKVDDADDDRILGLIWSGERWRSRG